MTALWLSLVAGLGLALAYRQASLAQGTVVSVVLLAPVLLLPGVALPWRVLVLLFLLLLGAYNVDAVRRALLSGPLLRRFRRTVTPLTSAQRQAVDAGTVWWEGELIRGAPMWDRLLGSPRPQLDEDERAFLAGPVESLCAMLNDWEITHVEGDLPPAVWDFLKHNSFFGLAIPQQYGGLEFSAWAHSCVLSKIASRSLTAAYTIAAANAVGPAQLIVDYGTRAQREDYLPRLAAGEDIPCLALASTASGVDSAAIEDVGEICVDFHEGEEILGVRLDFNKRYVSLGPIATLVGLAFKLRDPHGHLGGRTDLGLTLALVPMSTPGVRAGRRHFPLNAPLQSGPVHGEQVFIPLDNLIGGIERAGDGARMLAECRADGRAITVPSIAAGSARAAAAASGAYARVRQQFGQAIAQFDGVAQVLARIAGNTYLVEAANRMTLAAIDLGEAPAVASAIVKSQATELSRQVTNDAMDLHGTKAIMLGPSNYAARAYQGAPMAITADGPNLLTRAHTIFGQGIVRCHPWRLEELRAAARGAEETREATRAFDNALTGHLSHTLTTLARALIDGATDGRLLATPGDGPVRRYYRQASRLSAALAAATEFALASYRGRLATHQLVCGRLGDALSALYLVSAALKRYEDDGAPEEDLPLLRWCCETQLTVAQGALHATVVNLPGRPTRALAGLLVLPLGRHLTPPDDALTRQVADALSRDSATRTRLTEGTYLARDAHHPIGLLDELLESAEALAPLRNRVREAAREGRLHAADPWPKQVAAAGRVGVLDGSELHRLQDFEMRLSELLQVDDFDSYELGTRRRRPLKGAQSLTTSS